MINKKTKGLIKETDGGLGREFFPRGAAVWIPAALFVLLVLFQMVPLPAGVLKVVSSATYELYEEMVVWKRQKSEDRRQKTEGQEQKIKDDPQITQINADGGKKVGGQGTEVGGRLATDTHRLTQTFVRRTSPDKKSHRFAKRQQTEERGKDEHRTLNVQHRMKK